MQPGAWCAALTLLAGCGHHPSGGEEVAPRERAEIGVIVENQYAGLVSIYLDVSGRAQRLGEVHFAETRSFVVPWRTLSEGGALELRGEVIGSDEQARTGVFKMMPGSVVRWTLTPRLTMSYYAVY